MRRDRRILVSALGSRKGRRRPLSLSQWWNYGVRWVNKRFFGLLMVEEGWMGTMLSMRASSLWNKLLFFTNSFENSRAP